MTRKEILVYNYISSHIYYLPPYKNAWVEITLKRINIAIPTSINIWVNSL